MLEYTFIDNTLDHTTLKSPFDLLFDGHLFMLLNILYRHVKGLVDIYITFIFSQV